MLIRFYKTPKALYPVRGTKLIVWKDNRDNYRVLRRIRYAYIVLN